MGSASNFGLEDDPIAAAEAEVAPYRALGPEERYSRFLDVVATMEGVWRSLPPEKRRRYAQAADELDDLGRWWKRVPSPAREA